MRAHRVRRFAGFCLVGGLLGLPIFSARADDYRYPMAAPVLRIALPEDWDLVEQDGPAKLLLCTPPQDPTYTISVMTLPTVGDKTDLKAVLTRIVQAGAQGSGMTGITVSEVTETRIKGAACVFTKITATGKHDDESSAYTYYAFSLPGTGKTYAVGVAGLQAMIDAHKTEFEAVAKSIQPVR